jgi:chaperone modulatory protein CbpM
MITIDIVVRTIEGLDRHDLERWIDNRWVRPDPSTEGYVFRAIDLERVRLIHELSGELQVNDEALPVVLCLLDQVYALRRQLHDVASAIRHAAPPDVGVALITYLEHAGGETE